MLGPSGGLVTRNAPSSGRGCALTKIWSAALELIVMEYKLKAVSVPQNSVVVRISFTGRSLHFIDPFNAIFLCSI